MNKFKYSGKGGGSLKHNGRHNFAMSHSMMLYKNNALYSFIPKNGCSTLRLSAAIANGCIEGVEQGNWIHANNQTFNATLAEAVKVEYSFVVLRCPFRRLASVFLDKFVAKEPDAWSYRDLLKRTIELNDLSFRDFVLSLKAPIIFNSNIHWRQQVDFLIYQEYSDYFSLENFSEAVKTLKNKIDFNVVDARQLTNHGTDNFELQNDKYYADMSIFDIALLKQSGKCPSHSSMYDKELYSIVSDLYQEDINLYTHKCNNKNILKIDEVVSPILDINNVTIEDVNYSFDVDFLRDEAIRIESCDLPKAFKLMSLAHQVRPTGPFIEKKLKEYKQRLKI